MEGISFMVRVRNEERTVGACVASLLSLTIPMEIVVVLHRCTDASESIVRAIADPRVRVHAYDHAISRAGYETLATDADSAHSIVTYDNWCFALTSMPWVFKWDADFVATRELRAFLAARTWTYAPGRVRFTAASDTRNAEWYLACGQEGYAKYLFWEVPRYATAELHDEEPDVAFEHRSALCDLKDYWLEPPWFETEQTDEARVVAARVAALVAEFGPEPNGAARASNPECDALIRAIVTANPSYVDIYR